MIAIIVLAQDENLASRTFFQAPAASFQSVDAWHADIHYNNVWLKLSGRVNGLKTIRRMAHHPYFRMPSQQCLKPIPKDSMVIGQQYSYLTHFASLRIVFRLPGNSTTEEYELSKLRGRAPVDHRSLFRYNPLAIVASRSI